MVASSCRSVIADCRFTGLEYKYLVRVALDSVASRVILRSVPGDDRLTGSG
jgi:hypothetical protein